MTRGEESVMGVVMSSGLNVRESRVTVPTLARMMVEVMADVNARENVRDAK